MSLQRISDIWIAGPERKDFWEHFWLHALIGFALAAVAGFGYAWLMEWLLAAVAAIVTVVAVASINEWVYQMWIKDGQPNTLDRVMDVVGWFVGSLPSSFPGALLGAIASDMAQTA